MSGASGTRTFLKVSLPIMLPGLAAGWALLFVLIAGDVTTSAILAAPSAPVAGYMLLQLWNVGTYPLIAAFALVVAAVSTVVVSTVLALTRRAATSSKLARAGVQAGG